MKIAFQVIGFALMGAVIFCECSSHRRDELKAARDWQTRAEQWRSIALTLKAPGADRPSRPSVQTPSVP